MNLLGKTSMEQRRECMAFVDVAKNLITPDEFGARARIHSISQHEEHCLLEKLGDGYVRKALARFGLQVVAN